jgi:sterol desaturase/sphingolipid hydroxylase (fatty acid hydroxylase superfamily)
MEFSILFMVVSVLLLLERVPRLRCEALPLVRRYAGTDMIYLLSSGILLSLAARDLAGRLLAPERGFAASLPLYAGAFVLFDAGAYVSHRLLHRVGALWALHKVHHSSRSLDWLATFRGHILEHGIRQLFSPVLLIAAGVPLTVVGPTAALHAAWAAFVHSNLAPRLRWLDPICITPRLHRLHHVAATCDRNFGTVFSAWDRLSGTLLTDTAAGSGGPLGVPGQIDTYPQTWGAQLVEPLRELLRPPPALIRRNAGAPGRRPLHG